MNDTRKIFDAGTEAMNRHDTAAIVSNYSPDVVLTAPDGPFSGIEDVAVLEDGQVISHRMSYDQSDFIAQFGLAS